MARQRAVFAPKDEKRLAELKLNEAEREAYLEKRKKDKRIFQDEDGNWWKYVTNGTEKPSLWRVYITRKDIPDHLIDSERLNRINKMPKPTASPVAFHIQNKYLGRLWLRNSAVTMKGYIQKLQQDIETLEVKISSQITELERRGTMIAGLVDKIKGYD